MSTKTKKQIIYGAVAFGLLLVAFAVLCAIFKSRNINRDVPLLTFAVSAVGTALAAVLNCRIAAFSFPVGYFLGTVLGVIFERDYIGHGGESMNSLWVIFVVTLLISAALGIVLETALKIKKYVQIRKNQAQPMSIR